MTVLAALVGCVDQGREGVSVPGPELAPSYTVTLQETDSLFLANPREMAVDSRGRFYVGDAFHRRVIRFSRSGEPDRAFGRHGRGPGEFVAPATIFFPDDTTVAISDANLFRIALFHSETGTLLRTVPMSGHVRRAQVTGDQIWLGALDVTDGLALTRWDYRRDTTVRLVPLPEFMRDGTPVAGIFDGVSLAPLKDGKMLVGIMALPVLLRVTAEGRVLDSVPVPAVRRRGVPDDLARRLEQSGSFEAMFRLASYLFHLGARDDGSVAVIYYDQEYKNNAITAQVYVSVLSADQSRLCADAPVPGSGEIQLQTAFAGDTLVVLDQKPVGGDRLVTTVTGYLIDTERCDWIPTRRSAAATQ